MNFFVLLTVLATAVVSLCAVSWCYFKILKIAKMKNLVDNPDARKLQKEPIPVTGGIAVFFGVICGSLVGVVLAKVLGVNLALPMFPIICSMVAMLYVGAMDDIVGLSPASRLVVEVFAVLGLIFASGCCVDNFYGMWGIHSFSWWVAVPLTVFAGVGIINAVNMIDGVNGLSSGLCITCSCLYGAFFLWEDDMTNAILAFAMATALVPFFLHNVFGNKSRMFIGDAGTMMMGILLTWFTISSIQYEVSFKMNLIHSRANMIALALSILSVPIFDTIRVMTMRIAQKKSPFHPDKTHLHHVFVGLGVSHSVTTAIEISINVLIFLIWYVSMKLQVSVDWQFYIVCFFSMVFVWGAYGLIRWHANHHTLFFHRLTHYSVLKNYSRYSWRQYLENWLDGLEMKHDEYVDEPLNADPVSVVASHGEASNDIKENDRQLILNFIKGKYEVHVVDIISYSGANKLRIYPIILEEVAKGSIRIISSTALGSPDIVAWVND